MDDLELLKMHLEYKRKMLEMRRKVSPPRTEGDPIGAMIVYFGTIFLGLFLAFILQYFYS